MYRSVVFVWLVLLTACVSEQPSTENPNQPQLVMGELSVSSAWIRSAPPSSGVLGGYMTLNNGLDHDVLLISASSEHFGAVEFHQMSMHDGQMRMRPLDVVTGLAESQTMLSPGDKHLMLFRPKAALLAGERVLIRFLIQNPAGQQDTLDVRFLVRDKGASE